MCQSNSKGVLFDKTRDGVQFIKYTKVRMQSLQYSKGIWDWKNKALATFKICWCLCSTTEFCCGLSTHEWKESIPCSWKTLEKVSSCALSECIDFILIPN